MVIAITFSEPGSNDRLNPEEVECLFGLAKSQHDMKASIPAKLIFWVRDRDFRPGRMN